MIVGEDVAMSVHDGVLGCVIWYGSECSCQCMISGLSYASVCLMFKGNFVIVGEGIVVGAFVVIALNTMMMAHFGVMVSALTYTEMSALMCAVLTNVYFLRWWGDI